MRMVTYSAACSLDGFIAGPDGAMDWLHFSRDVQALLAETWRGVDAILMGRNTYEFSARAGAPEHPGVTTYVFSRTLQDVGGQGRQLVSGDAAAFVRGLKAEPGGGIFLMGGGELAASLLAAGLVDRIQLNIQPVLLGGGARLLGELPAACRLRLVEARPIDGGCLVAVYEPEA